MKILHIIPNLRKGGAERIALDICIELAKKGNAVQLITFNEANEYPFLTEQISYKSIKTSIQLSLIRKNKIEVSELQRKIDDFNPDIIHSHLFESEINLAFCSFPKHTKRVVHFHDNMKQMKRFSWKTLTRKTLLTDYYERSLVLKSYPDNTQFIGISKDSYHYIQQNIPKKWLSYQLHNAIDTKRFIPNNTIDKEKSLVMIGSFVPIKGQELAINTIKELSIRGINTHLFLLGDGQLKKKLRALTKQLNIEHLIHFEGNVHHPELFLQKSSIYIHTTLSEAFGLALIEAMACGLPVVCTDGKGNRDLMKEGKNGFMVWERNARLLADRVQFLLENEKEREKMGEYAHSFAQQFGMEEYVRKIVEIYD